MESFVIVDHLEDLDLESKYLAHKAKDAANHAYAPYSKFLVGAAVLLDDGTIVTESIITKIAIVAKRKGGREPIPATSCGPCRQVMLEFEVRQEKPIQVIMQKEDHKWVKAVSAQSLLPFSFTKASLEHSDKK